MKQSETHLVAVYGTLLSGFHNHYLLQGGKFIGNAQGNFPSVMFSSGGFPKLDLSRDEGLPPVQVEIYEVSTEILEDRLDALEGYPEWYDRTTMEFTMAGDEVDPEGYIVSAWIYHQQVTGLPVVESNSWRKYREAV